MKESEIRERLRKGWIRGIVTFEVAGKPKAHVEAALAKYLENIAKDERIEVLQEEREEATEHEDGVFSTFSECDMLVKNLETFTWLCINFSPASIEILEPDDLKVDARELTNWLNDLLAKLHEIAQDYRGQKSSREQLTVAMNQLIKNAILLSLKTGGKDGKGIAKDTGILEEQLTPFLEHLIEKKLVRKDGERFSLP